MQADHFEYIFAVSPLLLTLFAVPTVEEAISGSLTLERPVLCGSAAVAANYKDLVLTEAGLQDGRWWTLVTHMFLHKDVDHLLANLRALLINGYSTFRDSGSLGLYGVFFCAGAVSGLNRRGRLFQATAQLEASIPRAPERLGPLKVPEKARDAWDSLRQGTARRAAPIIHANSQSFGASGGAAGLLGYGVGTAVLKLGFRAADWRRSERDVLISDVNALMTLVSIVQCGSFLIEEWRAAVGEKGFTSVDHAGHLTGFATGILLATMVEFFRWRSRTHELTRRAPPGRRFVAANGDLR